ncbi:MAG: beta-lactamase family protein [Gammaproteobacteria bacterium]|nr:beta-lactamase family protein [Gammaproteobacteria bacterium]
MKLSAHITAIAVLTLGIAGCGGNGNSISIGRIPVVTPPPAAGTFGDGRLTDLVEWTRFNHGLPAMGVVIVENGQIVELAATGLRSATAARSVSEFDRWHLGSLTKGLTASLAGVLVEQSVLTWNTTPLDVWPEIDSSIDPQFRNITLRNLLAHTAGIQRVNSAPSLYGDLAAGSMVEKRRAFAAELLADNPVAPIGTHSYSNGGYIIAGAMMETLMSSSWETLMRDFVFAPLDMLDSGFGAPGQPGDLGQPWGHWDAGSNFDPVSPGPDADNPQVFGPAGTVHATMQDYARFMIAHINGANGIGGLVSAETFAMLHTPLADGSALGWGVTGDPDEPGLINLVHAGSNLRWYAKVRLVPELNVGALFVVNAGGDLAAAAIDSLESLLEERFDNSR